MSRATNSAARIVLVVGAVVFTFIFSVHVRADDDGAKLYTANKCASCHGPDGSANVPAGKALKARDFHSPDVQGQTDAELATVITNGKNKMPAYGKQLKPAEIATLVAYSRALGKK
jgi:cytochrome c6